MNCWTLSTTARRAVARTGRVGLVGLVGLALLAAHLCADSFSVDSLSLLVGGGTSTNAQFTVSGTVARPITGTTLKGERYTVVGGFLGLANVIPISGVPVLKLTATGDALYISWPDGPRPFALENTRTLSLTSSWSPVATPIVSTNGMESVTLPTTSTSQFFRLRLVE